MPSTTSSSLFRPEPSSTVITPSLPTLSIASAMILPISASPLAEIEPTCAISLLDLQGFESFFSSSTVVATALSMPRFRSIGFMPAATNFMPSCTMDCASTVAVVVPSPATSEVLEATSFSICAPMFSNLSLSSISFATDTPSLVTVGAPNERSSTTLRPLGPSVTLTASARMLAPCTMRARADSRKRTSLAAMFAFSSWSGGFQNAHDVVFTDHEQFFASDFDCLPGVFAEQHLVALFDFQRAHFAIFHNLAVAYGEYFALVRFFSCRVGNDDARSQRAFLFQALDQNPVAERTYLHKLPLLRCSLEN